jgi:threonine dehydrogenase-like Zn-dependent dehydrogenase
VKAVVFEGPHKHVIKNIPEPKPERNEVLLKPGYCGVCVTEKHRHEGLPDPAQWTRSVGREEGHEFGALIVKVGPDVQNLQPGQRVVVDPFVYCNECVMCRAGFHTKCQAPPGGYPVRYGGYSEYCTFPEYCCYPIPDSVSDLQAASAEGLACGTRAVRLSGINIGDNVVLLGAEDWNMGAFQWVKGAGANKILCADPIHARREMLNMLGGATDIIDPNVTDPVKRARELMPFGADVVFIAVEAYDPASQQYLRQACAIARPQGSVVITRMYGDGAWKAMTGLSGVIIRSPGVFGQEPWRGGRARSDYAVTIDGLASGTLNPRAWTPTVVSMDDLRTTKDLEDLYHSLPAEHSKIFVKIWGTA